MNEGTARIVMILPGEHAVQAADAAGESGESVEHPVVACWRQAVLGNATITIIDDSVAIDDTPSADLFVYVKRHVTPDWVPMQRTAGDVTTPVVVVSAQPPQRPAASFFAGIDDWLPTAAETSEISACCRRLLPISTDDMLAGHDETADADVTPSESSTDSDDAERDGENEDDVESERDVESEGDVDSDSDDRSSV